MATHLDLWHSLQATMALAFVATRRALRISYVDGATEEDAAEA
jgi:hypothetical protein